MKKKFFNMIEVLLALGVTAIGIMGIMAVIPVTLNANRDASADSYITDVVNTKFTEIAGLVRGKPGDYFGSGKTATAAPTSVSTKILTPDDAIPTGKNGVIVDSGVSGVHYFQVGKEGEMPDFTGHLEVWYDYPKDFEATTPADNANKNNDLIRFYVRASWPAEKPYDDRKKRVYVREYHNPEATKATINATAGGGA